MKKNLNRFLKEHFENNICGYCEVKLNNILGDEKEKTIEHLICKSNGGSNHKLNLMVCCRRCNTIRADNSLEYFLESTKQKLSYKDIYSETDLARFTTMIKNISFIIHAIEPFRQQIKSYSYFINPRHNKKLINN